MSSELSTPSTMNATKHRRTGLGPPAQKGYMFPFVFGDNGLIQF